MNNQQRRRSYQNIRAKDETRRRPNKRNKKRAIKPKWFGFTKMGKQIEGTNFVPFKTPMESSMNLQDTSKRFTPAMIMEQFPTLRLVVNLTFANNGRFYNYDTFTSNGIDFIQIKCQGHGVLPKQVDLLKFYTKVDAFLQDRNNKNALIGVHCTHGVNRTSLFICKYMVEKMGIAPDKAISAFQIARGHKIERQVYIDEIKNTVYQPQTTAEYEYIQPAYQHRRIKSDFHRSNTNPNNRNPNMRRNNYNNYNSQSYVAPSSSRNTHNYSCPDINRRKPDQFYYTNDRRTYQPNNRFYPPTNNPFSKRNNVQRNYNYNWRTKTQDDIVNDLTRKY